MAERSFKEEVQKLYLGEGEEFAGEGILAVTKALLQAGVSYVAGYQGAPISHLMDVLADANDILEELGVHFEISASEATAAATLAASVNYPLRGAVTFKSTVGTNVASDALANLASGGVTGGAHADRRRGLRRGLLDHAGAQPRIRDEEPGLAAGPASEPAEHRQRGREGLRTLGGHQHARDARSCASAPATSTAGSRPRTTCGRPSRLKDAMENPRRDVNRIVLPPASFLHEKEKIEKRWPAAVKFIEDQGLNEFFAGRRGRFRHRHAGRHVQHRDPRAGTPRAGRRVRAHARAALCAERHLSAGRRGTRALLLKASARS